ncbi:dihydrofolate reductase [Porphyromonadaceae bacterium OttesenSCG-928-L07]|nr:dihydrofolate reductase [Porphyromonadaceae bacterium OttesenSCG-928-L07]MDL2251267.1 dihydrofolate reductase [Odoribacter sp. OttesenSCG-928-J03]
MILSIIVAASENYVIGKDNKLLWHISADLKRFRSLTTGHSVIMGRKTYESIGKPLPNRRNIVISGNPSFTAPGCEMVNSIEQALELVEGEEEVFVIGGGSIYNKLWNKADRLYLTRVYTQIDGDTFIPEDLSLWREIVREDFKSDEKNEYDYSFINYIR